MSINSLCSGDQIVLQPLTDFKASEYLEHFPSLVFIECFCVLMKDIQLAKSAAAHFSMVRRKKWQQKFGQQVPTSLLQELLQYLHSQEFQVALTPLTCQTRSVTEQSHQKLVKNESGVK